MSSVDNKSSVIIGDDQINLGDLEYLKISLKIELKFSLEKILGKDYLAPSGKLMLMSDTEPEEVYDLVLEGREPEGFVLIDKIRSHLLVWQSKVGPFNTFDLEENIENVFTRYLSRFDIVAAKIFFESEKTTVMTSFDSGKGDYYLWPFKALLTKERLKPGIRSRVSFF